MLFSESSVSQIYFELASIWKIEFRFLEVLLYFLFRQQYNLHTSAGYKMELAQNFILQ